MPPDQLNGRLLQEIGDEDVQALLEFASNKMKLKEVAKNATRTIFDMDEYDLDQDFPEDGERRRLWGGFLGKIASSVTKVATNVVKTINTAVN